MELGLLDLARRDPRRESLAHGVERVLAFAKSAELAGFDSVYLAEHHTPNSVVWRPELFAAACLQQTQSVRIGTAGLLPLHHSARHTAEIACSLIAMAPDRVIIGLGRGLGVLQSDQDTLSTSALRERSFPSLVREIIDRSSEQLSQSAERFFRLLSSSTITASTASEVGVEWIFGDFLSDRRHELSSDRCIRYPPAAVCFEVYPVQSETEGIRVSADLGPLEPRLRKRIHIGSPNSCATAARIALDCGSFLQTPEHIFACRLTDEGLRVAYLRGIAQVAQILDPTRQPHGVVCDHNIG